MPLSQLSQSESELIRELTGIHPQDQTEGVFLLLGFFEKRGYSKFLVSKEYFALIYLAKTLRSSKEKKKNNFGRPGQRGTLRSLLILGEDEQVKSDITKFLVEPLICEFPFLDPHFKKHGVSFIIESKWIIFSVERISWTENYELSFHVHFPRIHKVETLINSIPNKFLKYPYCWGIYGKSDWRTEGYCFTLSELFEIFENKELFNPYIDAGFNLVDKEKSPPGRVFF